MENKILLHPNPATISYLRHFQVAQVNLNLFIQEERIQKRKRRHQSNLKVA